MSKITVLSKRVISFVTGKHVVARVAQGLFVNKFVRALSDSATSTDAGTVLSQNYVNDPFYFADDYVGTKRTF